MGLPISPQIQAHPIPTKINLSNSQSKVWIHNPIFQIHKQNSLSMSKLPNCERINLKSFTNIWKAYGLDQQRENNIGIVESSRSET